MGCLRSRWPPTAVAALAAMLVWINAGLGGMIVTKNEVFYIPFSVTSAAADQMLELFVSGNQGASWQLYQQQPASAGKFSFRAADDGEFWFAVRVADGRAQMPQPMFAPELKVAVDRAQPALTALGARTPSGQVVCRWSAEDPHLDLESITVEYQLEGQPDWTVAATDALSTPDIPQLDQVAYGNAVLPGIVPGQTVRLRVSARDEAGNVASTEREYNPAALPLIQDFQLPVDASHAKLASSPLPSVEHAAPPSPAVPSTTSENLPTVVSSNPPDPNGRYGWQQSSPTAPAEPAIAAPSLAASDKSVDLWPAAIAASQLPPAPPLVRRMARSPQPESGTATQPPAASLVNMGSAGAVVTPRETMDDAKPVKSPAVSHRISKSHRFEIDYDLHEVSADSVHRVEVWYTSDGGRSWRHHGDDEDRQSPYLMQVNEDGLYGVRLLIQTRVGYNVRPPASGEPADVWINVDATPPVARITSVEYGKDASTDSWKSTGTCRIETWLSIRSRCCFRIASVVPGARSLAIIRM